MVLQANPDDARSNGHRTANRAVEILLARDDRYRCPKKTERKVLLEAYARHGKTLFGAGFDILRLERDIDLANVDNVSDNLDAITVCEIKSSNRASIGTDLKGYFFNITAAELLTAQSVGAMFRFLFVNTATGHHREMALNEIFGNARAMYPAWHIRF